MQPEDFTLQSTLDFEKQGTERLKTILAAAAMGVLGALLFFESRVGLNATLWVTLLFLCVYAMGSDRMREKAPRIYLAITLAFAFLFLWRDSVPLQFLTALSLLSITAVMTYSLWGFIRWDTPLVRFIATHVYYALELAFNPLGKILQCADRDTQGASIRSQYLVTILRGMALLAPLVLLYLLLLGGRRMRFAGAAWCWSLLIVFILHVLSPDAVTMRVNLDRAAAGKGIDLEYALFCLSPDSVPVAMERMNMLGKEEQIEFRSHWNRVFHFEKPADIRAWTYGEWRARRAITRE